MKILYKIKEFFMPHKCFEKSVKTEYSTWLWRIHKCPKCGKKWINWVGGLPLIKRRAGLIRTGKIELYYLPLQERELKNLHPCNAGLPISTEEWEDWNNKKVLVTLEEANRFMNS